MWSFCEVWPNRINRLYLSRRVDFSMSTSINSSHRCSKDDDKVFQNVDININCVNSLTKPHIGLIFTSIIQLGSLLPGLSVYFFPFIWRGVRKTVSTFRVSVPLPEEFFTSIFFSLWMPDHRRSAQRYFFMNSGKKK